MLSKRVPKLLLGPGLVRTMSSVNTSYCLELSLPFRSVRLHHFKGNDGPTAYESIEGVDFDLLFDSSQPDGLQTLPRHDIPLLPTRFKSLHNEYPTGNVSATPIKTMTSLASLIPDQVCPVQSKIAEDLHDDIEFLSSQLSTLHSDTAGQHPSNIPFIAPTTKMLSPTVKTTPPIEKVTSPIAKIPILAQSPPHKKLRIQAKRAFSTSEYPTIQLATQRPNPEAENTDDGSLKAVKPMVLSKEQQNILDLACHGTSLFYTGSAGTGKSVLLRAIIKQLRQKHETGAVAVTASTGLAACNIGGITLHSFAGVGLGNKPVDKLLKRMRLNKKTLKRWTSVKVLIIDEVSMIDGDFLDKLNTIAKSLRRSKKPFGGIQLVLLGDFYQLPPVSKKKDSGAPFEEVPFAFESETWRESIQCTLVLQEVFRQKGDSEFVDMLNEIRGGEVLSKTASELQKLSRELPMKDGIEPAQLYPTRAQVERANNIRLEELKSDPKYYESLDTGTLDEAQIQVVLSNSLAPRHLFLKKGAQVMCIKNLDNSVVNGLLGQVVDFMCRDTYMVYNEFKENPDLSYEELAERLQAHRNATKSKAREEGTEPVEDENGSKIVHKTISNDSIFDFLEELEPGSQENAELFEENKRRKIELLESIRSSSRSKMYPLVRFLLPDGFNTREILVEPEDWTIEDENETVLAKRVQLPVILAWSISIHKSQGQTLPKVKIDLKRIFERGQAYVALSRAVLREGLQILNFLPRCIMAHDKVIRFYESLSSIDEYQKGEQIKSVNSHHIVNQLSMNMIKNGQ